MGLCSNDFSVAYVARQSNTELPLMYRISAVWGGHEGSLLLWAFSVSPLDSGGESVQSQCAPGDACQGTGGDGAGEYRLPAVFVTDLQSL